MTMQLNRDYQKIADSCTPENFGCVAVLFGGTSAEREISLESGHAVTDALKNMHIEVHGIDVQENLIEQMMGCNPDRAFIALHGVGGEDGRVQAVLEYLNIPYTGSDHAASALGMNKINTKRVWQSINLPTPNYAVLKDNTDWQVTLADLGGEAFVKPVREGSSLGMALVSSATELENAYREAGNFDNDVIAEQRISGAEFTVGILNDFALPVVQLKTSNVFYDYHAKYIANDTQYLCPCGLPENEENILRDLALRAFQAVGCSGWGRVDFMQDQAGNFYLLEVNTVPGMTSHSLVPMAAKAMGLSFAELVLEILAQTLAGQSATGHSASR